MNKRTNPKNNLEAERPTSIRSEVVSCGARLYEWTMLIACLAASCTSTCEHERAAVATVTIDAGIERDMDAALPGVRSEGDIDSTRARHVEAKTMMVRVPEGTFKMGSKIGVDDEGPIHVVHVRAFFMDLHEVTANAYDHCVRAKACTKPDVKKQINSNCNLEYPERSDHPINCVDWHQATRFCAWVGKRLPTEEEWEYAARGTDARNHPWGNALPEKQACWNTLGTCPVRAFPADKSAFGILNMAGNVSEWTASGYSENYNAARVIDSRVYRGGDYATRNPDYLRSTVRRSGALDYQLSDIGFRCARDAN